MTIWANYNNTEINVLEELENCIADAFANFFAELNDEDENLSDRFSVRVWEDAHSVYIAADGTYGDADGLEIVPVGDPSIPDVDKEVWEELGSIATSNGRGGYNVIVTSRQRDLPY